MQSLKDILGSHQADQSGSLKFLESIPEDKPSFTPRNRDSKKTPTYCVQMSPRVSVKRTTAPPLLSTLANLDRISTARDEGPGSRSARKPATFRLTRPSTNMRVGAQSLKSLNFSNNKAKAGESDDEDVVIQDDQNLTIYAPLEEEPIMSADEKPQHATGKEGVGQFYKHYRQLDKIKDINGFKHIKDTAYTSFLKKTEGMNLLPSKLGIVKERGSEDRLKINHFRIGDKYAAALSEGLRSATNFKQLELANNRLTPAGADLILSKLAHKPELIDLSGNNIGKIGCDHLCTLLMQRNTKLLEINLEGNKLGDYALTDLCEAIGDNDTIRKLNLNRNFLTNKAAADIGSMIKENSSLEEIYLRWNQIKGSGGIAILEGMKANPHIRVLDISWNSLGLNNSPFSQSFAEFIVKDKKLVHLDLSNNYFTKNDAQIISKALEENHSLYGFHFQGNVGYVDSKGFLVVPNEFAQDMTTQVVLPSINGVHIQPESLKRYQNGHNEFKDVCWICEGWRPAEIKWKPGSSGPADKDPIFVHFSYEGYKGRWLPKKKEFSTVRMVPPVAFGYLYTVEDSQLCAENQPSKQFTGANINITSEDANKKTIKPEFLNWMISSKPHAVLSDDFRPVDDVDHFHIQPRIRDETYVAPEALIVRPEWKYQNSSFRDYRLDNQALLDRCFEVDFEGTRISKLVKNEHDLKAVRDMLHSIYRSLKDCYKYYAAIGAPSEIWCITLNMYTDLCVSCGIVDGKLMKTSDFDRVFIATYTRTEKDKNSRNPDRSIVRYQFLEGLVRMAGQKYLDSKIAPTYPDAVKMLLEESVKPFVNKFDHQKWRIERYWNEEVDCVIKSYLPIFKGAYKRYSGLKTLPGQKKFMSLGEFCSLINNMELVSDNVGERDSTLFFSLAMMTQVDELDSDRIFQMQFIEFLEAFARIADKFAAAPYGQNDAEYTYEQRFKQPLYLKLEGLMQRLYAVCGNDIKDIWILPETTIFDLPEVKGRQRFFTKKRNLVRVDPTDPYSIDVYGV